MTGQPLASSLLELMYEQGRREIECQAFLEAASALLRPPMSRLRQVVREQRGMAGNSDYFLICDEIEGRRTLHLWEAKAPQLAPFRAQTKNRLMPSEALVEAENQLLHYYDEYKGSAQFRDRYELRHPDDVRLGGIIIGRDDNWVDAASAVALGLDAQVCQQMARSALRLRREHFYRDALRIYTWHSIPLKLKE